MLNVTLRLFSSSAVAGGLNPGVQNSKKINMYNQFAQVLLGYTGSENTVEIFESDLNFADDNNQMKEVVFVNFSRLLVKDQIKKGSFSMILGTGSFTDPFGVVGGAFTSSMTLSDVSASSAETGIASCNGGDYGVLFQTAGGGSAATGLGTGSIAKGIVFYQAGIVVLTASVFSNKDSDFYLEPNGTSRGVNNAYVSASISGSCDAIRRRIRNISYGYVRRNIYFWW